MIHVVGAVKLAERSFACSAHRCRLCKAVLACFVTSTASTELSIDITKLAKKALYSQQLHKLQAL